MIHDVALQKLPVIFCLDRAGLVGEDGATHHGVFDISYLRCIPNIIVFAPRNEIELRNIMYTAQLGINLPIAVRYPRGSGVTIDWKQPFSKIKIGQGVQLKDGGNIAVLSIGTISKNITEAIDNCKNPEAISHFDMRFVKPLDEKLLHVILKKYDTIITIEDNSVKGGFGSAILEFTSFNNYNNPIKVLGIPDTFIEHGSIEKLQQTIGLDVESLSLFINKLIKKQED